MKRKMRSRFSPSWGNTSYSFLSEIGDRSVQKGSIFSQFLLGSSHSHQPVVPRSESPGKEVLTEGSGGKEKAAHLHGMYHVCNVFIYRNSYDHIAIF